MTPESPALYEHPAAGLGPLRVVPVDPPRDAALIHAWATEERARFWGMREATRADIEAAYAHLDTLTTHHAYLVRLHSDPVALLQTYEPTQDRVCEVYEPQPGDVGAHIMVGPARGAGRRGFTAAVLSAVTGFLWADPARRRIVAEPDVRNVKAIERLLRTGFEPGPEVTLPEVTLPEVRIPAKRARLLFLRRG
ncbi:GNAT family N-acetyltransferase [Streptomyces sp. B1866]|uniref:GNAT family N-acetyltransferase n=1 Tax=Streptomyces sp. B1866 TaxID=3075431 RepID=UPI00288FDB0E|nr:GNAT family N-acetyltransferase [Streptomyces sp. B1866]MDT3399246.1 GNAT family N-acetyltransferase [Streptomyces sp. B1866]